MPAFNIQEQNATGGLTLINSPGATLQIDLKTIILSNSTAAAVLFIIAWNVTPFLQLKIPVNTTIQLFFTQQTSPKGGYLSILGGNPASAYAEVNFI